jgi:hypothetical protein
MKTTLLILTTLCSAAVFAQPAAPQLLIPAAGNTPGAYGTFFRSDITLVNFTAHDQIVRLQWLPQGGTAASPTTITLPSQGWLRSLDFVGERLGQAGLGAIMMTGITSGGDIDPTASLFATTRIWTPQPGTSGTTSQTFPAVPVANINTPSAALFGVGGRGNYRTNIGIVNLDSIHTQTFAVGNPLAGPLPPPPLVITVPPMSMQQVLLGSGTSTFGVVELVVENVTDPATRSNSWIAYSSTVDNVTGDAWSELAIVGAPIFCCPPIW